MALQKTKKMKKLFAIVCSILGLNQANAQCPNWLNSAGDAQIIIAQVDKHTSGTLMVEPNHQPGTDYFYYNADKTTVVRLALEAKSDKLSKIVINGTAAEIDALFTNYFKDLPKDCVTDESATYINFKNYRVTIMDRWNKPHTTKEGKSIVITAL